MKTAAICVAKLYDINPSMVEDQGFLDQLKGLLSNSNPTVVANAVAALVEIDEASPHPVFKITKSNVSKLLAALEECTEWCQTFILNALVKYDPKDSKTAENICTRVTPRLQHANSSVVLSAIRVLMQYMNYITNESVIQQICSKLGPPLVTLLSKQPEIQYVALRNINLILQKRPSVLQNEIRVFFCKYNDPIYVKMEKLEIMIMLANDKNIDQVLLEFKEYSQEVDVEFVRKAVRAIGRCAIKLKNAAEKCVHVLIDIIKAQVDYVVQESIVVIKDIFRKYPNRFESVISLLCENLDSLDDPEAKASMIWIIGEYAEAIDQAEELLEMFLKNFMDEPQQVQLQLLTAVVKLFLKRPKTTQQLVQDALSMATQESDNPDLRDRGYIYWRLLATDPDSAKRVILAEKPLISDQSEFIDSHLIDDLISNISTLASVYHKPPETFVPSLKGTQKRKKETKPKKVKNQKTNDSLLDLTDIKENLPQQSQDLFDFLSPSTPSQPTKPIERFPVLSIEKGKGIEIYAGFNRINGRISLEMTINNGTNIPITHFNIKFNKNYYKLAPEQTLLTFPNSIFPGQSMNYSVPCNYSNEQSPIAPQIDVAIKVNDGEVFIFTVPFPLYVVFTEDAPTDKNQYLAAWKQLQIEKYYDINNLFTTDLKVIQEKLNLHNIKFIANRSGGDQFHDVYYMSAKVMDGTVFLLELAFRDRGCQLCVKTAVEGYIPFVQKSIERLLITQ